MQLVELETQGGRKVWVNPEHIVSVGQDQHSAVLTDVFFGWAPDKAQSIKGAIADVVKKINDAMKA